MLARLDGRLRQRARLRRRPCAPAAADCAASPQPRVRVGRNEQVGRRQRLMIHAPAVMKLVVERDSDHLRRRRDGAARGLQRAGQIDPVEAQDHVGGSDRLRRFLHRECRRRAGVQRMIGGEHRAASSGRSRRARRSVSASATRLAQACSPREPRPIRITGCFAARSIATACVDLLRRDGRMRRRHEPRRIDRRQRFGERRLLHAGIEIDVHRTHRRRATPASRRATTPRAPPRPRPAGRPT